jgi:hypothetical protein
VNVKDDGYGWTPLHWAAYNGHIEISRLLLQNGAEVNARSSNGYTPLHWAASNGHVDILHLLVENGANLEAQSNYGERALHLAARYGHLPFIQELISRYHVDINARVMMGEQLCGWLEMAILTHTLQSLTSFKQMAVYRVTEQYLFRCTHSIYLSIINSMSTL